MQWTNRDIEILKELSKDSRQTVTRLGKAAKCSRITARKAIEKLESGLNLRYTLEINDSLLATRDRYVLTVRFSKKPDAHMLDHVFADDNTVHAVYQTDGDYDLIVYARTTDSMAYLKWEAAFASKLSDYRPTIRPSGLVISQFGYMPLNGSFVNDIKGVKVTRADKNLLRLLNGNSRASYESLAKAAHLNEDTVRYRIYRLKRTGIIKRFTVAAQQPPDQHIISAFVNYRFHKSMAEKMASAKQHYVSANRGNNLLNAFQYLSHVSGSYRLFMLAIFDSEKEAMDKAVRAHEEIFSRENTEVSHAKVVRVVKGLLPFRNINISQNYVAIDLF